ncbi:MAG TPA: tRNA lysidine(34) synthetase TilS [Candidatus Binataceae bacterium]|nr:tRNA lysidine(34) synthetase TilS [Candidatus Binataceae bacterium]
MSQRHRKNFLAEVKRALARAAVRPGASILVALSGGPDSVALLHALASLRESLDLRIAAAHLNHGLRGAESDRDESFCRDRCKQLSVELKVDRTGALRPGMPNLEEKARDIRRAFLELVAGESGADYIALAHHADDQAETVLMRLLRGAGVAGLAAMAETGPGRIIRPLLSLTRRDILDYLDASGATYVTDTSNASTAILRNRIRHDLLPSLDRDYAPGVSQRLAALAQEMQAVDSFLARAAARELASIALPGEELDISRFSALDPALRVPLLRLHLAGRLGSLRRLTREHLSALVDLCLEGPANGEVSLPGRWRAVREYDRLRLVSMARLVHDGFSVPIAFEGTTVVAPAGVAFEATVRASADTAMPATNQEALFDVRAIAACGLTARNFRAGDRIRPLGLSGTRKVKEVFIDRKLPARKRAVFPVVTMGSEIVWLPGLVRGDGALVTSASETVLHLRARHIT